MKKFAKKTTIMAATIMAMLLVASCGEAKKEEKACEHQYTKDVTTEATCTEDGVMTYTCSKCGDNYTEAIEKIEHTYTSEVTKEATCAEDGESKNTCSECGESHTEVIEKNDSHKYNSEITTKPTCSQKGVQTFKCEICENTYTKELSKIQHVYEEKITKKATCQKKGEKVATCTACGDYKVEVIPFAEHNYINGFCSVCNAKEPVELNMTYQEKADAMKVEYISNRSIDNDKENRRFCFSFSLKDEDNNYLKVPVIAEMKITNTKGEVVYEKAKKVTVNDYSAKNGYSCIASVYIDYSEIEKKATDDGEFSVIVYNDYVSFSEYNNTVWYLPVKESTVEIPTLPKNFSVYKNGERLTTLKITEIEYKVDSSFVSLLFTGEKTYDDEGNSYSRSCGVGWKLYDSEGYLLKSGTYYTDDLKVGEKFRAGEVNFYLGYDTTPGDNFKLELLDVDW